MSIRESSAMYPNNDAGFEAPLSRKVEAFNHFPEEILSDCGGDQGCLETNEKKENFKYSGGPVVVVFMEGGIIQDVQTNRPVQIFVVDWDTEGAESKEILDVYGDEAVAWEVCPDIFESVVDIGVSIRRHSRDVEDN